ncbi:hypothetical protein [Salipaludibacillus neizhouensis]|nr:hypothetical protein [Salipaludibacillus neizhouensis]
MILNFFRKNRMKFIVIGFLLLFLSIIVAVNWTDKKEVSENFAKQLFEYPLPPQTEIIEKEQVNGKGVVSGNGGYWGVIASIHLQTTLSKEDILSYYQGAGLFTYPDSTKKGVELEIYFEDDVQKIKISEGYYFRSSDGGTRFLKNYSENNQQNLINNRDEIKYVVQITNDFDYFPKLD